MTFQRVRTDRNRVAPIGDRICTERNAVKSPCLCLRTEAHRDRLACLCTGRFAKSHSVPARCKSFIRRRQCDRAINGKKRIRYINIVDLCRQSALQRIQLTLVHSIGGRRTRSHIGQLSVARLSAANRNAVSACGNRI